MTKAKKIDPAIAAIFARAEAIGLSPLGLCEAIGKHHSVVNRWRTGETSPTLRGLREVSDALAKLEAKAAKAATTKATATA